MPKSFFVPTRVVSGQGSVRASAALLSQVGSTFLVVTGAHSARATGALADVEAALTEAGCEWQVYDQVGENPSVESAFDGAALVRSLAADAVLAIGGGSPMDAAKAMALIAANPDLTPETLFSGSYPGGCLPIVCVPTTAGTGSEVTKASILTDDVAQTKRSISTPLIFPALALLDGAYTATLSARTTTNTVVDALSHAAEGFVSAGACPMSDALAIDALGRIGGCLKRLAAGTLTPEDRESLMAASCEAGMVIANTGTTAVHGMGYSLTYFRHIPHGRANGLLMPAWFSWVAKREPARVQQMLDALGISSLDEFAEVVATLLGEREELSSAEAADFAERASHTGNIANCLVRPTRDDLEAILRESLVS